MAEKECIHVMSRSGKAGHTSYEVTGAGPALILIHGVGLDLTMWTPQVTALAEHFQIIRYDMLGHGRSERGDGHLSLSDFVEQLDQLLDHLELASVFLAGFSMGGAVAMSFAATHPQKVSRLVLMHTVYRRTEAQINALMGRVNQVAAHGPASTADAALERWFSPGFRQANPGTMMAIKQRLVSNDPVGYLTAYRLFAAADGDLFDAPAAVRCPALVMTGELDIGSTPLMSHQIAQAITTAECVILPGQRHMAPTEAAESVNRLILNFLTAHLGA